ncbi:hypothetical protein [Aeromonas allosaccharophila]|uniref:hypothetical protein n=1 Tax=Aeromonas allosaccharophila TaxID=656 RepID=UPI003D1CB106
MNSIQQKGQGVLLGLFFIFLGFGQVLIQGFLVGCLDRHAIGASPIWLNWFAMLASLGEMSTGQPDVAVRESIFRSE